MAVAMDVIGVMDRSYIFPLRTLRMSGSNQQVKVSPGKPHTS